MMRDEVFWNRVNAALDERRDPLADELVQDAIAERPERLDRWLALDARLRSLSRAPKRHRVPRQVAVAAGLLAVFGGALAFFFAERDASSTAPIAPLAPGALASDPGEVVDFRIVVSRRVGDEEALVRVDARGVERVQRSIDGETVAKVSVESIRGSQP